jgi:molybdopterin-guanine dinucleotide biosynthesis protein A
VEALAGAVLAGGKSSRFGRNKAVELYHGERLIDRVARSLRPFCNPVMIVANDLESYYSAPASLVRDVTPAHGPLGGIYTALLFSPCDWVFVKAVDMPCMSSEVLHALLALRGSADIVAPLHGEFYEPLMALYSKRCMPVVARAIEAGERQVVAVYKKTRLRTLSEKRWRKLDPEGRSFWNVNTQEDLEKLQWT